MRATIEWKLSRSIFDFVSCQKTSDGGCAASTTKVPAAARARQARKLI